MSEPELIQKQRELLTTFRQATAQRAQIEAEANAQCKRELSEIATRYQSANEAAEQERARVRARADEALAFVDKALEEARTGLTTAGLAHLLSPKVPAENRLGLTLAPDAALATSQQRAVEATGDIQSAVVTLAAKRARQAQRRRWVIGLTVAVGIICMGLIGKLTLEFPNYLAAQQASVVFEEQGAALRAQFNTQQRGNDLAEMVPVPAGIFTMGSDISSNEKPAHTVYLDAFWIDVYEVTNVLYKKCVDTAKCQRPSSSSSEKRSSYFGSALFDYYPVIYVSWNDAQTYCTWAGKRLPTEAEWEKAARGTDGRIYPWGNSFEGARLNSRDSTPPPGDTTAVGAYRDGASPYGAMDMAGNVWEWVADWYDPNYYANSPLNNPKGGASGQYRVLRGGAWNFNQDSARAAGRYFNASDGRFLSIGYRCAQ